MSDAAESPKPGDSRIVKRFGSLVVTAGIPGVAIGALGDLASPVGGWAIVGVIGIIGLCVAVYILAALWGQEEGKPVPRWQRISESDSDQKWIWRTKPPVLAHGVHVIVVFSLACTFCAVKSFELRQQGGVLASNAEIVKEAQKIFGVLKAIDAKQDKLVAVAESTNSKADNFKKETSVDPRKEIANLGLTWNRKTFAQAMLDRDERVVSLFLRGGKSMGELETMAGLASSTPAIIKLISTYSAQFDTKQCFKLLDSMSTTWLARIRPDEAALVRKLCARDIVRDEVRAEFERALGVQAKETARIDEINSSRRTPDDCIYHELRAGVQPIMQEATSFRMRQSPPYTDRELWLLKLRDEWLRYEVTKDFFADALRSYCIEQAEEKKPREAVTLYIQKWRKLSELVNLFLLIRLER